MRRPSPVNRKLQGPIGVAGAEPPAGDAQGDGSPLVGGAGSIDACQRFVLARSVLPAWGEPARPGLPPEGETGKGEI